jgi:hypothetical protein
MLKMSTGTPMNETAASDSSELSRWLGVLIHGIESVPPSWETWQQTRDHQEIVRNLAMKLGYPRGRIERRKEDITLAINGRRERHEREWIIAVDKSGDTVAVRFDSWVTDLDHEWPRTVRVRGGMGDEEFRDKVLVCLAKWRKCAPTNSQPSAASVNS